MQFVKQGLEDLSISRSSFDWGVRVPWDDSHVVYVWFDALLNYISAIGYVDDPAEFARRWPAVHIVGKDIARFHAVIWPAMLMAAGLEVPKAVFGHGWLLVGGEKMSKSKLTGIAPNEITDVFGSDAFRYYFLSAITFGQDGSFSWEDLSARYQAELANGLGNLASRVVAMVDRYFDGAVPELGEIGRGDEFIIDAARQAVSSANEAITRFAIDQAIDATRTLVMTLNGYITDEEPWAAREGPGAGRPARDRPRHRRPRAQDARRAARAGAPEGDGAAVDGARRRGRGRVAGHPDRHRVGRRTGRAPRSAALPADRESGRRRWVGGSAGVSSFCGPSMADSPPQNAGSLAELEPLPVGVHDDHTHLNFSDDVPVWTDGDEPPGIAEAIAELDAAESVGVLGVVQVGTNVADSRWAVALAGTRPARARRGRDPPERRAGARGRRRPRCGARRDRCARCSPARARDRGDRARLLPDRRRRRPAQFAAFEAHIDIAKRHGLALQIHDRDAHDAVLEVLGRVGAPERTVLHCFSGDAVFARRALDAGCHLSFAGTVTFSNAGYLREALSIVPLDRILVETDAPFLTPHPFRGRRNSPSMIPVTLRAMAATLGIHVAELGTAVAANAIRVYGSWA